MSGASAGAAKVARKKKETNVIYIVTIIGLEVGTEKTARIGRGIKIQRQRIIQKRRGKRAVGDGVRNRRHNPKSEITKG